MQSTKIHKTAINRKKGMTLGELKKFVLDAEAANVSYDAHPVTTVRLRGQITTLTVESKVDDSDDDDDNDME